MISSCALNLKWAGNVSTIKLVYDLVSTEHKFRFHFLDLVLTNFITKVAYVTLVQCTNIIANQIEIVQITWVGN